MNLPASSLLVYGADRSGLVYGFAFAADGRGSAIDADAAAAWLGGAPRADISFVWLHFDGNHSGTQGWLQRHVDLPEEFEEALRDASHTTRLEQVQGGLVGVLNDVVYDLLQRSSLQVATLWFAVGPRRYLVTVRAKPLRAADRLRLAVNRGEPFTDPLLLVVHLLRDQADVLGLILRDVTGRVDRIEDHFLAERLPRRAHLGQLRRDLVRLQRLLAPEPGAMVRLLNRPPVWIGEPEVQELRQSAEEFSLVLRDLSGLQERIKLLQEEIVALTGERMNRSIFVLTAVTVLALPINITAGLFGMNVGGIPLNQSPQGFWTVVGLIASVTGAAAWWLLRRRDD